MIEQWGRRQPRRRTRLPGRAAVAGGSLLLLVVVAVVVMRANAAQPGADGRAVPGVVELLLLDGQDERPISGDVTFDSTPAVALGAGRYSARLPAGTTVTSVRAPGYRPAGMPARRDGGPILHLVPDVVRGTIEDADGRPLTRATVRLGAATTQSDADGRFTLTDVPASPVLQVRAAGYGDTTIRVGDRVDVTVKLSPRELRAAYLSFFGVADRSIRDHVLDLVSSGELNAVVVDVKGDLGYVSYPSKVPLVGTIGANEKTTIADPEAFIGELKARGAYAIARIVVFKDDILSERGSAAGIDVAVKDASTGAPWTDQEHLGWVDPFREDVWDYNAALAEEAIRNGFDEVQFDYVRFPTDPGRATTLDLAQFSQDPTPETRPRAIRAFLGRAADAVHAAGGMLSADIFGYAPWLDGDLGIGQQLEMVALAVDYVSPMVYPSTFNGLPMEPAYADSPAYPYETVYFTLERARQRLAGTGVAIRPWLQYFDDYPWATAKAYGITELRAQTAAVSDLGLPGFMWWDPSNHYRFGASFDAKS